MPINVHRAPELALRIDLVLVGYAVVWAWLSAAACWPVADEAGAVSGSTAGDSVNRRRFYPSYYHYGMVYWKSQLLAASGR